MSTPQLVPVGDVDGDSMTFEDIFAQSHVDRWHMVRVQRPQNNAEHQYRVTLVAIKLYHAWLKSHAEAGNAERYYHNLEVERKILLHGLTHDVAEYELGDAPAPTKRIAAVKAAMGQLESNFWLQRGVSEGWSELVTNLVKIADLAESYIFSYYNQGLGHRYPDDRWKFVVEGLESALRSYVAQLPHPKFLHEFRARLLHLIIDQKLGISGQHA